MPWEIIHHDGEYCVQRQDTGETVHCHPTKEKAMAHLKALYANTKDEQGEESMSDKKKSNVSLWNNVLSVLERSFEDLQKLASDMAKKGK